MGCNGCGSCCDPVEFDVRGRRKWLIDWAASSDPTIDAVWRARWKNWKDADRPQAIEHYEDAQFILEHWIPIGDGESLCDAFDPETRTCLAYDDRPPICRNYPLYDRAEMTIDAYPWCGFHADPVPVPIAIRR